MNQEIIKDLKVLPHLSCLNEDTLIKLASIARLRDIPQGYILFEELEPIRHCYILKEGRIKLYKTSPEGRELIIRVVNSMDYICCESLFDEGLHIINAVAMEDSSVITLPLDKFREILSAEIGGIGLKILESLSNGIKQLLSLIEDLAFRDVEQRIILKLQQLVDEVSVEEDIVPLSLTHQDIASMVGTVREVVSRTMSRLKREGVIVQSNVRGFKIHRGMLESHLIRRDPAFRI